MFGISKATAFMLIKPLFLDILADIMTAESVNATLEEARRKLVDQIMRIVGKTHFSWDDAIAEKIIAHILNGGVLDKLSLDMIELAEGWIKDSETKWDDQIVLPALEIFKQAVKAE